MKVAFPIGGCPMTTPQKPVLRRRARQLLLGLIGIVLLLAIWGFCWWWMVLKPWVEERRPFVGTWRLVSPSPTFPARPELVVEKDLSLYGTIMERVWDPQARAVDFNQPSPARWHLVNGRFQEVIHGHDLLHDLVGVGGRTYLTLDSPVTWEGPDRFRVQGTRTQTRNDDLVPV
jgi:hypothetical protein